MYYVYILQSKKDHGIYIGFTKDLKQRFFQHCKGKVRSTKSRRPFKLVYYEAFLNETDARKREIKYKKYGQVRKDLFIKIKNSIG